MVGRESQDPLDVVARAELVLENETDPDAVEAAALELRALAPDHAMLPCWMRSLLH